MDDNYDRWSVPIVGPIMIVDHTNKILTSNIFYHQNLFDTYTSFLVPKYFVGSKIFIWLKQMLPLPPHLPFYHQNNFCPSNFFTSNIFYLFPKHFWNFPHQNLLHHTKKICYSRNHHGPPPGIQLTIDRPWVCSYFLFQSMGIFCSNGDRGSQMQLK